VAFALQSALSSLWGMYENSNNSRIHEKILIAELLNALKKKCDGKEIH
jgi:hypothetical protein